MSSSEKPKKVLLGDYPVGYAQPPKEQTWTPGKSGNPSGRPRGRPSLDELFIEEAARVVKLKSGDKVVHMDRDRALVRKLLEMALQGNMRAAQLVTDRLRQAQAALAAKPNTEAPLTEDEIALFKMLPTATGG